MTSLERLKIRLQQETEAEDDLLRELLASAESAIMTRRFPFGYDPENVEMPERYEDLKIRIALDMYNRIGAEGQTTHSENGVQRTYESGWISESLLNEVVPKVGVAT